MKKDIQLLQPKLRDKQNKRKIWLHIICILSFIAMILTIYLLMLPAIGQTKTPSYTLHLIDNYNDASKYAWKKENDYTTNYDVGLFFEDTNGNTIEGRDLTLDINPNTLIDEPYAFGYVPLDGGVERGQDLIAVFNLKELVATTGEKYIFDHAEVYADGTWKRFSETGNHWHIWCQSASSTTNPANNNYGWRGNYNESTRYNITSETQYKFVYKLVRYGQSNSVSSLGADSGISFNIFNYSGDNTETGVNANGLYGYFSFRGLTDGGDANINSTLDADGFGSKRAKVLPNLLDGYPVFNCGGSCPNASLGYLFGASTNPKGTTPVGVTSYTPTNTLLQKETIEGVEYYYYDSNRNAVDYDTENNHFIVRDYVERGYKMTTYPKEADRYEFLPFNHWNSNRTMLTNTEVNRDYNYEEEEVDHWFGMTMEFNFYMPASGTINEKDMVFKFSGDDDVWVFIDNVLVLDLGGTHGAVDGTINFNTGEVTSYLNWNGTKGTTNTTNIYDAYKTANLVDSVIWNDSNTTFANYTKHTLKFFYLERGASVSNCKIRFNIPVLPTGSLSVQKAFEGTDNYNEPHEFTLYDTTNGTAQVVPNTKYTIGTNEYYTDEGGHFTLKNTEAALFQLTNYHKYYVAETTPGSHSVSYKCSFDGVDCPTINQTSEFTINPDSAYQATFTNKEKTFNLKISKIAHASETNETFEFKINLKDKNALPVDIPDDSNSPSRYIVDHDNGLITFSLKNEETITINALPIDTVVTLTETKHDGYQTIIKTGDIILANSDTYEFTIDTDKDITVHNIPGITLPTTGGIGITNYFILGTCLILFSLTYRYSHFFKLKEGEIKDKTT